MGTLDASQRAEVLLHLKTGCPACNAFYAETRETVNVLSLAIDPIKPPPEARDRLMGRVEGMRPMRIGPRKPPSRRLHIFEALAGGAIAAGIMAAIFWQIENRQREQIASLQAELDDTKSRIAELRSKQESAGDVLKVMSEQMHMMQSPGVQMVMMSGTESQPNAKAHAYWDKQKSMIGFCATNLRPADHGKAYQLWLIPKSGAPIPVKDTFAADQASQGFAIAVPSAADPIVAFAMTQEPAKGSVTPTMPILMQGAIQ